MPSSEGVPDADKTLAPKNTHRAGNVDTGASRWLRTISSVMEARPWRSGDARNYVGEGGEVGPVLQSHHSIDFKEVSQQLNEAGGIIPTEQKRKTRHIQFHPLPKFVQL